MCGGIVVKVSGWSGPFDLDSRIYCGLILYLCRKVIVLWFDQA